MTNAIERHNKRLRDILLSGRIEDLAILLKELGHTPSSPEALLITWHKTITAKPSLPRELRQRSKAWLTAHGYHSLDDGDLKE